MGDTEILKRLRGANWERIYPSLIAYVEAKTAGLRFVKGGGILPLGHEPVDLVDEAIRRVFDGDRQWNPDEDPDLESYLKYSVLRSLTSNLLTSAGHQHRDVDPELDVDTVAASRTPDPHALAASDDCVEALTEICEQATEDDNHLQVILMGLQDGVEYDEIADLLSIDVKKVYTLTRKLRRRLFSAMRGHPCWEDHPMMSAERAR